ncbi:hypothetical protein V1511DRAFT_499317 [Dipodascopsis uninucleata]
MKFTPFILSIIASILYSSGPVSAQNAEGDITGAQFLLQTKFLESASNPPTIYNTKTSNVEVSILNQEDEEATVQVAGGALFDVKGDTSIENITAIRVGPIVIPPHSAAVVPYSFVLDREPKDYLLRIGLLVEYDGQFLQYLGYNSTITVADPPLSFFDPQLLILYVILGAMFGAGGYYVYNNYLKQYYAPKKSASKTTKSKPRASVSATSTGADPAKGYDESWIPEHHLRSKSPKPKAVKKSKKSTK